jgi:hypothetical protein
MMHCRILCILSILFAKWFCCFSFLLLTGHSLAGDTTAVRNFKIYPLPAIGYSPETRWYFGAVALINWRMDTKSEKPSTIELEFNYTQNKQFIYTESHELRLRENKLFLQGNNGFFRFPEFYWTDPENDNSRFRYDADRLELENSFLYLLHSKFFIGFRQKYHDVKTTDSENPDFISPSSGSYHASGMGPHILFDSRDNVLNASRGFYSSVSALFFEPFLGSDNTFQNIHTDWRYYTSVKSGLTFAFQIVSISNWGNIPFRMNALAGNESMMRGYYQGQYRDNHLLAAQAECRFRIWNWIGATVFTGYGKSFRDINDTDYNLPNYGAGLRIRMDKKDNINLRFDYGAGKNSSGFYVSFGEAF